ncbi:hypothetical protein ACQZ6F_27350 [Rhizobium sp. A22-96]
MKKIDDKQASSANFSPLEGASDQPGASLWSTLLAIFAPITIAVLVTSCFAHVVSPSWTRFILIGPAVPTTVYALLRRTERQRKRMMSVLDMSLKFWMTLSAATLFYSFRLEGEEFAQQLAQLNPGWLTLIFAAFFSIVCGRIAVGISRLLHR